jgi:hypothetical protein
MEKLYVIECGGCTWDERFVHAQDLPWNEWSRSGLARAKNFAEDEAKELIEKLGTGNAVLRSSFDN